LWRWPALSFEGHLAGGLGVEAVPNWESSRKGRQSSTETL
jgi:hypothetical protein